ncbi:MAG TPA: sodium:solute symporter family protein [Blastocatellia bacterium]|nr:sodium:solute symporter family protein [Blastocatellia bacterium]
MNGYVLVLIAYSLLLVAVGFVASRSVRTASDFFVARRRLTTGLLFATLLAANIGAGSTVGAAGLGYELGLSGWWWVGSAGIGSIILAFIVGPKLWRLAAQYNLYTAGDYLQARYSRRVRGLVAGLLWLGTLAILAGQLIAIAWILNVVAGLSKPLGCILGGIVTMSYFTAGGLVSAAWVNSLQVIVKLSGFLLALPVALDRVGGWDGLSLHISRQVPHADQFLSLTGIGLSRILAFLTLLAPSFIVSPGLIQKVYGAKDVTAVRVGVGLNACALLGFAFVPVLLGMAAAAVHPGLPNRELALPTVMVTMLPFWLGALALAAVFSAEVSTADALLFMLATSLSKDLYQTFLRPDATEKDLLRVGRWAALAGGTAAVGLAIGLPSIIAALSIFYSLVSVALFVPILMGLLSRRSLANTAFTAIVVSVAATAFVHLGTSGAGFAGISPVALGILISLVIMIAGLIIEGRSNRK